MHAQDSHPLSQEFEELAAQLLRNYPTGLRGSRQELLDQLVYYGLSEEDAEGVVRSLQETRRAHHIEGNWVFTRHPVELPELLRSLNEEYPDFVGHDPQHVRSEATDYIARKMGLDMDVAREVLEDLEAAGYATLGPDPDHERNRLLIGCP